jgi:phosphatidylinositol glycan class K
MLADDIPCNMRNPFRGKIFSRGANGGTGGDLMEGVEIDYAGTDVTVNAFLRVLLGRNLPGEGETKGLNRRSLPKMDENTNVMVLLTGHGGDNFFKFQDGEELMSNDIASAFSQMYALKRYREILFISDTCQAFTMADEIKVPNVYSVGSSLKGQNSYASHSDPQVGQSVIDRYSKVIKDFVDDAVTITSSTPLSDKTSLLLDSATVAVMERLNLYDALVRIPMSHGDLGANSQVGYTDSLCSRKMNNVPLSDFFAAPLKERERQVKQRQHAAFASLWMDDSVITRTSISVQAQDDVVEEECVSPETRSVDSHDVREEIHDGMSVFDLKFIAATTGLVLFINILSRKW